MFYANISMNMKDNTDRLLEAIEYPDRFSDEELRRMLEDNEIQELYKIINKTSDALTETKDPDIDTEWECFVERHGKTVPLPSESYSSIRAFFSRNAAILICMVGSLAVVAATIGIKYSITHPRKELQHQHRGDVISVVAMSDCDEKSDTVYDSDIMPIEPKTLIFKDEPFIAVIRTIAEYYGATVAYDSDKSKDLHLYFKWDQTLSLKEIVEQLNNFEQINIKLAGNTLTIE